VLAAAAAAAAAAAGGGGVGGSAHRRGSRFGAALDEGGGGFAFEVIEEVGLLVLEELVAIDPDNPLFAVICFWWCVCMDEWVGKGKD
jgi:hypothetical protein